MLITMHCIYKYVIGAKQCLALYSISQLFVSKIMECKIHPTFPLCVK